MEINRVLSWLGSNYLPFRRGFPPTFTFADVLGLKGLGLRKSVEHKMQSTTAGA